MGNFHMCWEHAAVRQMAQVQVRRNRSQALLLLTHAYSSGLSWHTVPVACRSKQPCSLKRLPETEHTFISPLNSTVRPLCSRPGLATSVFKQYSTQVSTLSHDSRHITSANPPTRFLRTSPASWDREAAYTVRSMITLDISLLRHAQAAETKQPLFIHRVSPLSHLPRHFIANSNTEKKTYLCTKRLNSCKKIQG